MGLALIKSIFYKHELAFYSLMWISLAAPLFYLVSLDVLPSVQLVWTVSAVIAMIFMRRHLLNSQARSFDPSNFFRLMIVLLAGMVALRYLWWRTFHSLPMDGDVVSMVGGLVLYVAELQAAFSFFMASFLYLYPLRRESNAVDLTRSDLPTVDVLVPTYNEPAELLRVTLLACKNMRYPADKINIYLLDDGGTVAHRQDPDINKAKAAQFRHEQFKELCEELGVNYLTREFNNHAKAGNLNAAMKKITGELIVVLDCDHVPTVEFLEHTVQPFEDDTKLWLVQTPHFLINEDPVERNLGRPQNMPSESEMFYTLALRSLDYWNAAFFCGSGAVMRRSCLDEIGGIATKTVTEDIETSIELHRKGYNSIYYHKPMLAGLQPETFTGFLTQRLRWAHGMIQVFMLQNPLMIKGLSFWQRLCYLNMTSFWFFSIMRLVFLLAPAAYLIFGIRLYGAPVNEILLYALPHVVAYVIFFNVLFGRTRWFLVSDVYEVLQSLFSIRTVLRVLLHPKRGEFAVTPKDENIQEDFISPVAKIFYILLTFLGVAALAGLLKISGVQGEPKAIDFMVTFWAILSFLLVLGSVGVLHEKKQVRKTTRFSTALKSQLFMDNHCYDAKIIDLSSQGMCMHIVAVNDIFEAGSYAKVKVYSNALEKVIELPVKVCMSRLLNGYSDTYVLGLDFKPESLQQEQEIIALTYGDSERWRDVLKNRNVSSGLSEGSVYFFTVCLPLGIKHIASQLMHVLPIWITFLPLSINYIYKQLIGFVGKRN